MTIDKVIKLNYPFKITESTFAPLFQNETANIIYIPEVNTKEHTGIDFVNKYRKKGIFSSAFILPNYKFFNRKIVSTKYIQEFKKKNPNVPISRKIQNKPGKINFIDLTPLMELFYIAYNISKFRALKELINYINTLINELNLKNSYIFYESNENGDLIKLLVKYFKKNSMKIPYNELKIECFIGYHDNEKDETLLYPLTEKHEIKEKDGVSYEHRLKIPILKLFYKDVLDEIQEDEKTEEEKLQEKKEIISQEIDKVLSLKEIKKDKNIPESLDSSIDVIYQEISSINPNKTFKENLEEFKEKTKNDKTLTKKIEKLYSHIEYLNKKYNGVIDLDKDYIKEFSNVYYNGVDVIGMDSLNIYNRQKTEFDESLDEAMFDLIKSIEDDKEAGVEVLGVETDIIDTNKDRLKVYKIKLKNRKFGTTRTYTQEIYVPYPIKNKYIKIGGNTYIMINQFFPKPILKVKPNMVRLYTHFTTTTVTLQTHSINEKDSINNIFNSFVKIYGKKKNKIDYIENETEVNNNLEKFGINPDTIFTNKVIEIG